jgi:RNA ligase (TIGR02306 family)
LPIEGADRIQIARVQGWQSVIKKDQYKVGDRIIFVPIDTLLTPKEWNKFLWDKEDPTKPIRVKTVKLRGTISQGLIFPIDIIGHEHSCTVEEEALPTMLGVTKYEKQIPASLSGEVAGDFPTVFISKTDEDNLKSNVLALDELKAAEYVQSTIKMDGTSATFIKDLDGKFYVCSRNLELRETEKNVHWKIARKYNLLERMKLGSCIQGEICGPGIQKNPMNLKEIDFFIFNYKDLFSNKYRAQIPENLKLDDLPQVPINHVWSKEEFASMTIDELQNYSNNTFYSNKTPAEGIVLRGLTVDKDLMYSRVLQKMLSVKILNQNYKEN